MYRLTIILFFGVTVTYGQGTKDYALYSKVIDSFVNVGIQYKIKTTQVVVIKKFTPNQSEIPNYTSVLQDTSVQKIYAAAGYDSLKIKLFKDSFVKNAITTLEKDFFETPILDEGEFKLNCKTRTISQEEFQNLFTGKKKHRVDIGWDKFYKMFPGAHGIFKFSKIIYSGEYACFYASRSSGGLSGRGDIVVMKKDNDMWRILTYINIWMS